MMPSSLTARSGSFDHHRPKSPLLTPTNGGSEDGSSSYRDDYIGDDDVVLAKPNIPRISSGKEDCKISQYNQELESDSEESCDHTESTRNKSLYGLPAFANQQRPSTKMTENNADEDSVSPSVGGIPSLMNSSFSSLRSTDESVCTFLSQKKKGLVVASEEKEGPMKNFLGNLTSAMENKQTNHEAALNGCADAEESLREIFGGGKIGKKKSQLKQNSGLSKAMGASPNSSFNASTLSEAQLARSSASALGPHPLELQASGEFIKDGSVPSLMSYGIHGTSLESLKSANAGNSALGNPQATDDASIPSLMSFQTQVTGASSQLHPVASLNRIASETEVMHDVSLPSLMSFGKTAVRPSQSKPSAKAAMRLPDKRKKILRDDDSLPSLASMPDGVSVVAPVNIQSADLEDMQSVSETSENNYHDVHCAEEDEAYSYDESLEEEQETEYQDKTCSDGEEEASSSHGELCSYGQEDEKQFEYNEEQSETSEYNEEHNEASEGSDEEEEGSEGNDEKEEASESTEEREELASSESSEEEEKFVEAVNHEASKSSQQSSQKSKYQPRKNEPPATNKKKKTTTGGQQSTKQQHLLPENTGSVQFVVAAKKKKKDPKNEDQIQKWKEEFQQEEMMQQQQVYMQQQMLLLEQQQSMMMQQQYWSNNRGNGGTSEILPTTSSHSMVSNGSSIQSYSGHSGSRKPKKSGSSEFDFSFLDNPEMTKVDMTNAEDILKPMNPSMEDDSNNTNSVQSGKSNNKKKDRIKKGSLTSRLKKSVKKIVKHSSSSSTGGRKSLIDTGLKDGQFFPDMDDDDDEEFTMKGLLSSTST